MGSLVKFVHLNGEAQNRQVGLLGLLKSVKFVARIEDFEFEVVLVIGCEETLQI